MSDLCEACILGKQHRSPFPQQAENRPLDLIFSDVHGPLPVQTAQGYRYWITFLDDATKHCYVVLLKKKSDTFPAFLTFKAYAENLLKRKIGTLRDDKGGEYISTEWDNYMKLHGIRREHTVRATPQQNGAAERMNRTLAEGVTSMLVEAKLPASFWGEALFTFLYVRNRSPTSSLPSNVTPYELWHKKKPSISHLRVFGCRAYVHIQKDQRKSLQSHSVKCIFLGYPDEYKGWKCYDPVTKRVLVSRDVIFNEAELPGLGIKDSTITGSSLQPTPPSVDQNTIHKFLIPLDDDDDSPDDVDSVGDIPQAPVQPVQAEDPPQPDPLPAPPIPPPVPPPAIPPPAPQPQPARVPAARKKKAAAPAPPQPIRKSTRTVKPPGEYWKVDHSMIHKYREPTPVIPSDDEDEDEETEEQHEAEVAQEALMSEALDFVYPDDTVIEFDDALEYAFITRASALPEEPRTFAEAMNRPDKDLWYKAASDEIQSHLENGT